MADIYYQGTYVELLQRISELGSCLAGRMVDNTGAVRDAFTACGLAVLADISDHFDRLSHGGVGDDGTTWPELAAVTLALRRADTSAKAVSRLMQSMVNGLNAKVPGHRQRLMVRQAKKLEEFYTNAGQRRARKFALHLLEQLRPHISKTRYDKTKKEIEDTEYTYLDSEKDEVKYRRLIFARSAALILRDTGDLFRSLEPFLGAIGQEFEFGPGFVEVGTKLYYASYHQSPEPRKLKADGTPLLPRRNFLPDEVPALWQADATDALRTVLGGVPFWTKFLAG